MKRSQSYALCTLHTLCTAKHFAHFLSNQIPILISSPLSTLLAVGKQLTA